MKMKRILAATDFSALGDAAIHRAAFLAAREDSELAIVHAMPSSSVLDDVFGADGNLPGRMRAVSGDRLAALVDAATQTGARRVRAEIAEGSAQRALADAAESFHPDLVVIGAHGKGLLQQFFLGGTASRILARAACPVLVARSEPAGDYRQALAAVDLGPRSEAVLRASIIVAARAHVTVAHAYQAPFEAKLRYKGFSAEDIARYSEPEAQAAQRSVAALLAEPVFTGLDLKIRIVHGHPNPALFDIANDLGADLIVAGKHGGSRLEESVMGSITRLLAYHAPCDVLVV
ncbi:MAG: universal stress protein [Propionivibrio sp.]|uniref:Universal stress protein n=1 Tax=Candidatus Propionivibrio dominans TaxID=2954373 RepID=A0A9D7FA02_9RHOO|nr:universal stress protein [Candidatus Propionivibrio dominans]